MKGPRRQQQEPRRFGNAVIIGVMLLSLLVLSLVKSRYCSSPFESDDAQLETVSGEPGAAAAAGAEEEDQEERDEATTSTTAGAAAETGPRPTCYESSRRSETCDAAGDIRVLGTEKTVLAAPLDREWKVKPYARKHDPVALSFVSEWTIKPAGVAPPACGKTHAVPALLFSNGGFTGNLYHDYTDVLVPLFVTAYPFRGEVQFVVSGLKSWWVNKFILILRQLTNYDIIDIDNETSVHCFPRLIAGLTFHKDMGVDPARTAGAFSVVDFKKTLRRAFGLKRASAAGPSSTHKPRLLIISRKNSRKFLNEDAMAEMAAGMGFDVKVVEPDMNTDMSTFAGQVNSADVMIGVHGAGLTNMVFLPRGAVLIQVVPFGGLEWLTRVTFKEPSADMEISYIDYNVQLDESSLADQYPKNHPVIADPYAVHKQGWDALKSAYLDKQNVRLNLDRLRATLQEALKLLPPASN